LIGLFHPLSEIFTCLKHKVPVLFLLRPSIPFYLCYWGVRELSMTTVDLARRLNLTQPTVSQAATRGQKIAEEQGLNLIEKNSQ